MAKTNYTDQAQKDLEKNASLEWVGNAFGVENSSSSDGKKATEIVGLPDPDNISEALSGAGEEASSAATDMVNAWDGAFDDQEGWENLGDAAAAAALNYLNSLLEKVKKALTSTTQVSVSTLIGEVAPYCINISQTGSVLGKKLKSLMENMGEWFESSLIQELNNLGDAFLDDPNITSAVSNLKVIQAFSTTLNSIASMLDTVTKVMYVVEPAIPLVEILANMALSFFSGGTSLVTATNQMQEYIISLTQTLMVRVFETFRKLIFNISFKVPSFLVTSLSSLKFNEATDISEENQSTWTASKNSGWGQFVSSSSSLLTGKTYEGIKNLKSLKQESFNDGLRLTKGVSDVLTTYGNKIGSGNLLPSFNISKTSNWKWTTTSASDYFSSWTSPVTDYISEVKSVQEKYRSKSVEDRMAEYVAKARASANMWSPNSYSSGNTKMEITWKKKTSVVPGSPRIILDEIRIMQESSRILISRQ